MTGICASAPIRFTIAARRDVSRRLRWRAEARSRTSRLYCRITLAVQNLAIAVCSAVRRVLTEEPYSWMSPNARIQVELVSAGGESGRNRSASVRMNGLTSPTQGVCGAAYAGGVRRQTPGPGVRVGKDDVTPI